MIPIIISFNRINNGSDVQLKFLLRSIEKFLPSNRIIIYGDEPSFVDLNKITYHRFSLSKNNEFSVHAKTSSEALQKYDKFFFVVNGAIFLKKIKKLSNYKTPAMRQYESPKEIKDSIYNSIPFTMYTFNFLSRNTFFTYPFVPCLCDREKLQPYKNKFPEIFTEFYNIPNALINILPSLNTKIYKSIDSFAIKISSFTQITLDTKRSLLYIPNDLAQDFMVISNLKDIFSKKSKWEK